MTIQRLETLCLEIFKTLHQLNPCFLRQTFLKLDDLIELVHSQQNLNLKVKRANQVKFGKKFFYGIFCMQSWTATSRHEVTRKRKHKKIKAYRKFLERTYS